MEVDNGRQHTLAIANVHSGDAGSGRSSSGALTVAFRPNIGPLHEPNGTAVLDGLPYQIVKVTPSPFTSGYVRIELKGLA